MLFENFEDLYRKYDVFLIDMYGVLWNGGGFFPGALELLEKMKNAGKTVIILSNTTMAKEGCRTKYQPEGLYKGKHFDIFISSGEAFKCTLKEHIGTAKTYFSAFSHNSEIFENSSLTKVNSIEKADFVYVGNVNTKKVYFADCIKNKNGSLIAMEDLTSVDYHDIDDFDEITDVLNLSLKHQKPLVIANPDIFALEAVLGKTPLVRKPVLCQGAIGEMYENAGGEVIYFGKPYPAIYDYAKRFIQQNSQVVMIGDTLWTDILGGNMAGFDTVLTLSGVVGKFIGKLYGENLVADTAVKSIIQTISPKMTHKKLSKFSQIPTHIIAKFAN